MIGNKSDLTKYGLPFTSDEDAQRLAEKFGMDYFKTSALKKLGINEAMSFLVKKAF